MKRRELTLWLGGAAFLILLLVFAYGDDEAEVERLADVLDIQPGDTVADVGAGDGWLSIEVAALVGESGQVFATELSADRRDAIRTAVAAAGLDNVTVVEAGEHETNLPPELLRRDLPAPRLSPPDRSGSHERQPPRCAEAGRPPRRRRAGVQRLPASSPGMAALDRRRAGGGRDHRDRTDPRRDPRLAARRPLRRVVPETAIAAGQVEALAGWELAPEEFRASETPNPTVRSRAREMLPEERQGAATRLPSRAGWRPGLPGLSERRSLRPPQKRDALTQVSDRAQLASRSAATSASVRPWASMAVFRPKSDQPLWGWSASSSRYTCSASA